MMLGDMLVVDDPPPKLAKALAVIAAHLHPAYARHPNIEHATKSRESCVLCSRTVRDFLHRIGFRDARVTPVAVVMAAHRDGVQLHSLGIGAPVDLPEEPKRWNGHVVVTIPSVGWLIDTTLYPAIRPQWPELSGMIAGKYEGESKVMAFGLPVIAGAQMSAPDDPGYEFEIYWLLNETNNRWRQAPDNRRDFRASVVRELELRFRPWREGKSDANPIRDHPTGRTARNGGSRIQG